MESKRYKVSVIISILNGTGYIDRIVDSLCGQTFSDFESVFVVDEKSTDGSIERTAESIKRLHDSRMVILRGEGRLGESRNLGLQESSGEWIWFLDVDDVPNKEFLSVMTSMQKDFDADTVVCNFTYSAAPKVRLYDVKYDRKDVLVMNRLEALNARSEERLPVQTWSKLVKRELMDRNNIRFSNGFNEDIRFTYLVLSASDRVCYYTKSLYSYQINPNSVCTTPENNDSRGHSEIEAYNDLEEEFRDDEFAKTFRLNNTLVRIRSSGHMSYRGFLKYNKSRECREMIERNVPEFNSHIWWYLHSPRTYYIAEHIYFRLFFYRNGKDYTRFKK